MIRLRASRLSLTLLAIFAGLAVGCGGSSSAASASSPPVVVFAAASLTAAFQDLARQFEALHPDTSVELHFAGTPRLVLQVQEGARADVIAAADDANLQRLIAAGQTASAPVVFARNRLTLVTARGNPKGVARLADLARGDLRVVLCGPEVPAGRYARQALAKAGVRVTSSSDEPSVNAVISKIRLGEVDAGIVYVTDATRAAEHVDAVAIPAEHDVVADYPIVVLGAGSNRAGGQRFVDFVTAARGRAVLERHGFTSASRR